jgi:hypothetical protein
MYGHRTENRLNKSGKRAGSDSLPVRKPLIDETAYIIPGMCLIRQSKEAVLMGRQLRRGAVPGLDSRCLGLSDRRSDKLFFNGGYEMDQIRKDRLMKKQLRCGTCRKFVDSYNVSGKITETDFSKADMEDVAAHCPACEEYQPN